MSVIVNRDFVFVWLTFVHVFQVAEDAMRTQYELKKKERSSMLANLSLEQHAFSFNQTNQFKIPELPSASGNIREKMMETMKDTSSPSTPAKTFQQAITAQQSQEPAAGSSREKDQDGATQEEPAGTQIDNGDDTESCYQTTIQESKRKRKWYSLF